MHHFLAVPKGFRITKYTIKIKNKLKGSYGQADYDILNKAFYGKDASGYTRQLLTWGQHTPWYFGEITETYAKKAANRRRGELLCRNL